MNRKKLKKRLIKAYKSFTKHCKGLSCDKCLFMDKGCCIDELRESIRVLQEKEIGELEGIGND